MKKVLQTTLVYLALTSGAIIYALSIALLLNPLGLAPGGVSGIAIIINKLTGLSTGVMMFLINVPLMLIAIIKFGPKFFFETSYVIAISSITTDFLALWTKGASIITDDRLLAAFAGGALMGIGIGIVFRAGATTGGTDILVKLLRRKYKHINTGTIFFLSDLLIIAISAFAFNDIELALYALISVFINGKVVDIVLYGFDGGKLVYIISDTGDEISKRLLNELETGVTVTDGVGAYSGTTKHVLLCAVKNNAFPKLRRIVKEEDKAAFVIVTGTTEVIGEGYKSIEKEEL